MLTANDAIYGWSPAGDDDVEVNVPQDMFVLSISPITSSNPFLTSVCPPLETISQKPNPTYPPPQSDSTPSAPSTAVTRTTTAPSSDRRAQRNRSRDPSWIPRPRNAFIIFRCEYSREHAQGSQESQTDHDTTVAVKTLSKRAAEAWKQLPTSERERYKGLADREREEHARLYPHYRFRPMKRPVSRTRNHSRERSQSPKEVAVKPIPASRRPSVSFANPQSPRSPSPEAILPFDSPPSSAVVELNHDDLEQAEALEAYAIGLYQHDFFSPFSFPEYY